MTKEATEVYGTFAGLFLKIRLWLNAYRSIPLLCFLMKLFTYLIKLERKYQVIMYLRIHWSSRQGKRYGLQQKQ